MYLYTYLFKNPTAYNPITRSPQRQKGTSKLESKRRKNSESVKEAVTCKSCLVRMSTPTPPSQLKFLVIILIVARQIP